MEFSKFKLAIFSDSARNPSARRLFVSSLCVQEVNLKSNTCALLKMHQCRDCTGTQVKMQSSEKLTQNSSGRAVFCF
jgi:hypothetical protein